MKRILPLLALALVALSSHSAAAQYTIWHSPLLFEPAGTFTNLTVQQGVPSTSVDVIASAPTDAFIQLPLTLPSNVTVRSVQVCYSVSDAGTFISQIRLNKMTTPNSASVLLDDGTDRTSTTPTCEVSSLTNLTVDGTISLLLRVVFADPAHRIEIGAIGIDVEPVASSPSLP